MIDATPRIDASIVGQSIIGGAIIGGVMSGLRTLAIAMTGWLLLLVPLSSTALADPSSDTPASAPVGSSIITIGDSVMLGARWVLQKDGVKIIDAVKNRQASTGSGLLKKRGAALPANVVVHLGTNGTFTAGDCRSMIAAAGPTRRVFFLTIAVPRPWEAKNNAVIRDCVAANPGRAFVIDWNSAVAQHPKWVYSDGTHLRPAGAKGYSRMIEQAVASAS
jgi:hypothetical protein